MGAKKKGANKLAKMSEEEKLRYLQHRAAIEEEARRRKQQLIAGFMKNKLKREEIFSRLNMAKINQEWRQTLRQIKCVELKQDVEDLFKWFDYAINKKNKMIEILIADLEEAEAQYTRIWNCHVETMDKLLKIYEKRLTYYHKQYKEERNELYVKAKKDIDDIIKTFTTGEEHLEAFLHKMEKTSEEKMALVASQHASKIDELRNNMLTELENLKSSREEIIEKHWNALEDVLKKYWDQTEDRRRQYLILRDADYENCKQIFENNQQINSVIDVINNLREQLVKIQITSNEKNAEYKAKIESNRELLFNFKKKVAEELAKDESNLKTMNSLAGKTTDEFKRILAKGKQILQLQSLCRKFETLNEKICPEGCDRSQLTAEEEAEIQEQLKQFTEPLAEDIFKDTVKLDEFWKRFNRAFLEKEALALHYKSLLAEQKQLKNSLKSYLSDMSVRKPESKISFANGVRAPRQRPFTTIGPTKKYPFSTITCIEATQSPSIRQILSAQMRKS